MYYQGNPLAFGAANQVPAGWKVIDADNQMQAGDAAQGPRTFKFNAGGDFEYGLYVRQSDASKAGYAEFGSTPGYALTLIKGDYRLTYNAVAWQGNPYMKCEVLNESGKVLGSQIINLTKNVDRNLNASTSGSNVGTVNFTAPSTGIYHFRWTPVANYNGATGAWLEAVFGHIKITALSVGAKEGFVDEATGIENLESNVNENNVWYTLQGVKLNAQPTQGGVYIHNGKKVLVK